MSQVQDPKLLDNLCHALRRVNEKIWQHGTFSLWHTSQHVFFFFLKKPLFVTDKKRTTAHAYSRICKRFDCTLRAFAGFVTHLFQVFFWSNKSPRKWYWIGRCLYNVTSYSFLFFSTLSTSFPASEGFRDVTLHVAPDPEHVGGSEVRLCRQEIISVGKALPCVGLKDLSDYTTTHKSHESHVYDDLGAIKLSAVCPASYPVETTPEEESDNYEFRVRQVYELPLDQDDLVGPLSGDKFHKGVTGGRGMLKEGSHSR